jgi:lysophospholipase L1-like esterase
MRALVFGDSITQGYWDSEGGWVARLRKHYDKQQLDAGLNDEETIIFNLGISGDVAEGVVKRLNAEVQARKWRWPDEEFILIFAIGINDSVVNTKNPEQATSERYRRELRAVTDEAKLFTDKVIFVGLTPCQEEIANTRPDKQKTLTNSRITEFDGVLKQLCDEKGLPYVPLFDALNSKIEAGEKVLADGLHPNDEGHELIFQLVRPELDKLLA